MKIENERGKRESSGLFMSFLLLHDLIRFVLGLLAFHNKIPICALLCNDSTLCYTSGGRTIAEKARWGYETVCFSIQTI